MRQVKFCKEKSPAIYYAGDLFYGGKGGIRTHGTLSSSQHFQCCQFNHSCTFPQRFKLQLSSTIYCRKSTNVGTQHENNEILFRRFFHDYGLFYNHCGRRFIIADKPSIEEPGEQGSKYRCHPEQPKLR